MLTIRLFGPVDIRIDDRPLAVDTRKAAALLAFVAIAGRATSREALAAFLWPDSAEAQARGALRRTLSVLNAALGPSRLAVDRVAVSLEAVDVDLDVERFRAAVAAARDHGHPPRQACEHCTASLEAAVSLARGPFMDGFVLRDSDVFEEWLLAEREAYQRELAGALERLVGEQLAAGAWDGAISAGRRWLQLDGLHEPAHRALMEAHARAGETSAAVQVYRDAASILDRELGVAPLPETTELYESIIAGVMAPRTIEPPPGRSDRGTATAPPLLGRDAQLARVLAGLDEAGHGGRVIALEGEAGVGKSRLADAVVEAARVRGHDVVDARCYLGERNIPLGPIVALLRSRIASSPRRGTLELTPPARAALSGLLPELASDGPSTQRHIASRGPAARLALFEAVVEALAGGPSDVPGRPAVVRVDDLQWADDSTLEVLAFLARRIHGRPLLLLLSWRREELDERTAPLIAEIAPGAIVRLERLEPSHIRRLVEAIVAVPAAIGRPAPDAVAIDELVEEAEGLPLYVVEALAVDGRADGGVPAGIRALLQARLAALSDLASQVVAAAAVIGRSFDHDMVRAVSGRSDEEVVVALEELSRRGVIRERSDDAGGHDFSHARLRDVAYEGTSVARRRLLHRRAAAAYRAHGATAVDQLGRLGRIARHEQEGGQPDAAALAFEEAGRLASGLYANREALVHLETAIALGHPDARAIHERVADVRTRIGDYPGAIAAFETAAATAAAGDLARIEHRVGRIHLRRGDPTAAEAHLAAAISALDASAGIDGPGRSAIQADRAIAAIRSGDPERAASLAAEARVLASGDVAAEVDADRILGLLARERGDREAARTALERSLSAARELDDPLPSIAAVNALALVAADDGDPEAAVHLIGSALATARQTGERHLEAALENNLADALEDAGRRDEAMEHLKAAAAAFADVRQVTDEPEPGIWMLESW